MGYAVVMFGVLLVMSLVVVTAYNYGIAKDSEVAPLKAENIYAEREAGKAQTGLTINNTCLKSDISEKRYTKAQGTETYSGPYSLYLSVRNNGSTILNPNIATVLYNTSYINFTVTDFEEEQHEADEVCEDISSYFTVWPPLTYVCMKASNIYIPTPSLLPNPQIMLLVTAENGVSTIAPTSPANFTGSTNKDNNSFMFSWNASYDVDGIAYYSLYDFDSQSKVGNCPPDPYVIRQIPGSQSNSSFSYSSLCPGGHCNTDWFYLTAVDNLGNEGIQSRTITCIPSQNRPCEW